MKKMWTVLVPTVSNEGKPFRTRFHKVWDAKVREITNGLTIMPPAKGQWIGPDSYLYDERVIPVMFVATEKECDEVISITLGYYDQLAVLCWEVSNNVKLVER